MRCAARDNRKDRCLALRNASDGRVASAPRRATDYSKINLEKVAVKAGRLPPSVSIRTAD